MTSKRSAQSPDISVHKDAGSTESEPGRAASPEAPPSRAELERVRDRDPEALEAFFDRYFDRVHGLVQRLVGDRSTAEDITQDVFLKAYRSIDRLDPGRDPAPWITTIAYNACRDLWRSGAHRMARRSGSIEGDPSFSARLTDGAADPEHELIREERARLVRASIDRLPEPLREAVLLHEFQGLSHADVARLTGLADAAARKRYSRALAALGKLLRENDT